MNYCYVFYVGNYVDVFKYVVQFVLFDIFKCKDSLFFVFDIYGGVGCYLLVSEESCKILEVEDGVMCLMVQLQQLVVIECYFKVIQVDNLVGVMISYFGLLLFIVQILCVQDCMVVCEVQDDEVVLFKVLFVYDVWVGVYYVDGYVQNKVLLLFKVNGVKIGCGLVLIDLFYEVQDVEYQCILVLVIEILGCWLQVIFVIWFLIKQCCSILYFLCKVVVLLVCLVLIVELLIWFDDFLLWFNGSGMLLLNLLWQFDQILVLVMLVLKQYLGEVGVLICLQWFKQVE